MYYKDVQKLINKNLESKEVITGFNNTVSYSGAIQDMTYLTQGTGHGQRVGNEVTPVWFEIKGRVHQESATGDHVNTVRLILFRWLQDSAAPPTPDQILWTSLIGTALAPFSPYEQNNRDKFQILYDQMLSTTETNTQIAVFNQPFQKLKRTKVQFASGVNDGYGHIYYLVVSDSGLSDHPTCAFVANIHYKDG